METENALSDQQFFWGTNIEITKAYLKHVATLLF